MFNRLQGQRIEREGQGGYAGSLMHVRMSVPTMQPSPYVLLIALIRQPVQQGQICCVKANLGVEREPLD